LQLPQLAVKGLVRLEKLAPFFEELRTASRHRTLSLALLRPPPDASPSASHLIAKVRFATRLTSSSRYTWPLINSILCLQSASHLKSAKFAITTASPERKRMVPSQSGHSQTSQAAAEFLKRRRAGVAEPAPGLEAYFLPPGGMADRLLRAAREDSPGAPVPRRVSDSEMLLVVIHPKVRFKGLNRPARDALKMPPVTAAESLAIRVAARCVTATKHVASIHLALLPCVTASHSWPSSVGRGGRWRRRRASQRRRPSR